MSIDREKNLVLSKWLRAVSSHEYRASTSYIIKFIKKNKADYWIIDATHMSSPVVRDQKWTVRQLGTVFRDTSLRKIAIVLPDDLFLEVVSEKIKEGIGRKAGGQLKVEHFRSYDQAVNWLGSVGDTEGLFKEESIQGEI